MQQALKPASGAARAQVIPADAGEVVAAGGIAAMLDARLTVDDHVQSAVLTTLTQHPIAFVEFDYVDRVVERCERVRGHVGEERMPRQALGHECQSETRWTPERPVLQWSASTAAGGG